MVPVRTESETYTDFVFHRLGSHPDIEQADVDMDDEFMAGTPLTPGFMAGTGRVPDEDDASTTEL